MENPVKVYISEYSKFLFRSQDLETLSALLTYAPKEAVMEILYKVDPELLPALCSSSQRVNKICEKYEFRKTYAKIHGTKFVKHGWKYQGSDVPDDMKLNLYRMKDLSWNGYIAKRKKWGGELVVQGIETRLPIHSRKHVHGYVALKRGVQFEQGKKTSPDFTLYSPIFPDEKSLRSFMEEKYGDARKYPIHQLSIEH